MANTSTPPRPKNYNAVMSAAGYGEIYVKVQTITYGMSIISSTSKTRYSQTVYTDAVTGGSFSLALRCTSHAEWERLGLWLRGYGSKVSDPASGVGPVRVQCAAFEFDKVAVPKSADFGDSVTSLVYDSTIAFVGSRDPVPLSGEYLSNFTLPSSEDKSLPYYYPGGTQLSGSGSGDDALYNWPQTPEIVPTITTKSTNTRHNIGV